MTVGTQTAAKRTPGFLGDRIGELRGPNRLGTLRKERERVKNIYIFSRVWFLT